MEKIVKILYFRWKFIKLNIRIINLLLSYLFNLNYIEFIRRY